MQRYDVRISLVVSDVNLFIDAFYPEDDSTSSLAQAMQWLKDKGVDISNQVYKTKSTVTSSGREQSDDLIFVGEPDDIMNAYIPQGTITFTYSRTDEYYVLSEGETPSPDWEKIDGQALLSN